MRVIKKGDHWDRLRVVTGGTLVVAASKLSEHEWAPFGWLPVADVDPRDGSSTLAYAWGDPHLNIIAHTYEEIDHVEEGAIVGQMFRHETHTQALMPLNVPAIIAVAPPGYVFSDASDLGAIRAFLLQPQDCLVLHQATWHWGPFPLAGEPVRLLNVQGLRYAEDNGSVDIAALGRVVVA